MSASDSPKGQPGPAPERRSGSESVFRGMILVAVFVLLGKTAGAAKEMAVAWRYGLSETVDAYNFVFNLMTWPVAVWASVLTIVFVPKLSAVNRNTGLGSFRAELLGLTLLLGFALTIAIAFGLLVLLRSGRLAMPPETTAIALGMVPTLIPSVLMGVLIALYSMWTMASGRHVNTLLEGVPALGILSMILLTPASIAFEALVWGTLLGLLLQLTALAAPFAIAGQLERPRFGRESPLWAETRSGFRAMVLGQAVMSVIVVVDQLFAASLGSGAIAALGYANRILALVLGLGALSIGRATLVAFSQAGSGDAAEVRRLGFVWAMRLLAAGLAASALCWWLAPWAVEVLFERGAFGPEDTKLVSSVLRWGLVQIPPYFAGLVLVSLLATQRNHLYIAIGAGMNFVVKLAATAILAPLFGIEGVILATGLMYVFSLGWLYVAAFRSGD